MAINVFKKEEIKKKDPAAKKEISGILLNPHVTEKATAMESQNYYIFKVDRRANKKLVKDAIEDKYKVDVEEVKVVNIHKKKVFAGRKNAGHKSGYKKALIRIKQGQKIDITK